MEIVGIQVKHLRKGNQGSWFRAGKREESVGAVNTLVFVLCFGVGMGKKTEAEDGREGCENQDLSFIVSSGSHRKFLVRRI